MAQNNARIQVIEQYLATQRRINDIEREALSKLASRGTAGPKCSFCGRAASDGHVLIPGNGDARICSECVEQLSSMLKHAHDR